MQMQACSAEGWLCVTARHQSPPAEERKLWQALPASQAFDDRMATETLEEL